MPGDLRVVTARDVSAALDGRERDVMDAVRDAYLTHGLGDTALPHSLFLRFSPDKPDRIIALPAYLGGAEPVAGVKWIASFPGNVARGVDRASAVLVLNSPTTGFPEVVMEGSIVSMRRTAASTALAARALHGNPDVECVGVVGCGPIGFEILRYLRVVFPRLAVVVAVDTQPEHARKFAARVREELSPDIAVSIAPLGEALSACRLLAFATTAAAPHVADPAAFGPDATVLNVSLRDFTPEVILAADNVVDDVDHVVRERTSLHLAELAVGHRRFVRCTLADVLAGAEPARTGDRPVFFSPFGLGILDLAVARLVLRATSDRPLGVVVPDFLPQGWRR